MQQISTQAKQRKDIIRILHSLVESHPTMRFPEILDKYNIIHITEADKHTHPDRVLARTYLKMHNLKIAQR